MVHGVDVVRARPARGINGVAGSPSVAAVERSKSTATEE